MRILLVVALAGCAARSPVQPPLDAGWRPSTEGADYGEYPADYEEIARTAIAAVLKDPESARFGRISKPRREHAIVDQFRREAIYGYSICVDVNAKNSYGGYAGFQTHWMLIRNGQAVRMQRPDRPIYIGHHPTCENGP